MYLVAWEFHAAPGREADFQQAYGRDGPWTALFRSDAAYLGTDLFRDTADPRRFLTIDRWRSAAAYQSFVERNREAYRELDQRLEPLSERETRLGSISPP